MIVYVSHHYPDLDSCVSIWLLTRFIYKNEEYDLKFVSVGSSIDGEYKKETSRYINVDTGGGLFDHHETNEYVCSASLIVKSYGLQSDMAISKMIEYVLKADHGLIFEIDVNDFDLLNIIEGLNNRKSMSSKGVINIALLALDGVYTGLKQKEIAHNEIKNIKTFPTRWGKGAAIETSNRKTRYLAHRKGYKVFVYVDPQSGHRGITADGKSNVDFRRIYQKVIDLEPNSDWFLHSSKQLLLCGSSKAPDKRKSQLSLEELIDLVR